MKKAVNMLLVLLNLAGIVCLAVFSFRFLSHDMTVPNPDAMLPMAVWEGAGWALTIGLPLLVTANLLAFLFFPVGKEKHWLRRIPIFLPAAICLVLVAMCWYSSLFTETPPTVLVKIRDTADGTTYNEWIDENRGVGEYFETFRADMANVSYGVLDIFAMEADGREIANDLAYLVFRDENGRAAKVNEDVREACAAVLPKLGHLLLEAKIFETGGYVFVAAKLNVNLHTPCEFYRFDPEKKNVALLAQWENVDVLEIALAG